MTISLEKGVTIGFEVQTELITPLRDLCNSLSVYVEKWSRPRCKPGGDYFRPIRTQNTFPGRSQFAFGVFDPLAHDETE